MENVEDSDWNEAWSSMPSRRMTRWSPRLEKSFGYDYGEIVTVLLAEVPEQFRESLYISDDECPICGSQTEVGNRLVVNVSPTFTKISHLARGAFAHKNCFNDCPLSFEPTGVPW